MNYDFKNKILQNQCQIIEEMLVQSRERAKNFKHIVPVDLAELARNATPGLQINGNLHKEGGDNLFTLSAPFCDNVCTLVVSGV